MFRAEFLVRYIELLRVELLHVGLASALDVAGAPAGVDEFPFIVVDANSVPRVVAVVWGEGGVRG